MPSAVELDLKHWVRVVPVEGKTQVVTCRSFACFYSGLSVIAPPELATEGTELTTGSTLTIEGAGRWFIAKKAATTEEQLPSLLEVAPATQESITTTQLAADSVTEPKVGPEAIDEDSIKKEAVTAAKALKPQVLVASGTESLTAEVGTAGVARSVIAVYNAKKEASAKVKIKHELGTEYVAVTAWKASAKKATEKITDGAAVAGAISKVAMISANEIEVTLVATEPAAKEELWYVVTG